MFGTFDKYVATNRKHLSPLTFNIVSLSPTLNPHEELRKRIPSYRCHLYCEFLRCNFRLSWNLRRFSERLIFLLLCNFFLLSLSDPYLTSSFPFVVGNCNKQKLGGHRWLSKLNKKSMGHFVSLFFKYAARTKTFLLKKSESLDNF